MPLSKASLSTKIKAAIIAESGTPEDADKLQKFADAMADAIVDEITSNALVTHPAGGGGTSGVE